MAERLAIDPAGCGCTECIVGEYVPIDSATPKDFMRWLFGGLQNNTGMRDDELSAVAIRGIA